MVDSVQLYGVKETLNELKRVQPEVYKQLVRDIKQIVSGAVTKVRSEIPAVAPLSGMNHNGISAYAAVKVTTRVTPGGRAGLGSTEARLVQIEAKSVGKNYGFEMADMAGRGSGSGRRASNMTRPYTRNGKSVSYPKNGQGQRMINQLGKKASRYVYGPVESDLPAIQMEVLKSLDVAASLINRKLDRL